PGPQSASRRQAARQLGRCQDAGRSAPGLPAGGERSAHTEPAGQVPSLQATLHSPRENAAGQVVAEPQRQASPAAHCASTSQGAPRAPAATSTSLLRTRGMAPVGPLAFTETLYG